MAANPDQHDNYEGLQGFSYDGIKSGKDPGNAGDNGSGESRMSAGISHPYNNLGEHQNISGSTINAGNSGQSKHFRFQIQEGNQSNMARGGNDTSIINNRTHHVDHEGHHNVSYSYGSTCNDSVGSRNESSFNISGRTQDVSNVQGGNQSNMAVGGNDTSRINNLTHHVNDEWYHDVSSSSTCNDPIGSRIESSFNNNRRTQDVSSVLEGNQRKMASRGNDAYRINNRTHHVNHEGYHNVSCSSTRNDPSSFGTGSSFNTRRTQDVSNVQGRNQSKMARGSNDTSRINNLTHHVNHEGSHNVSSGFSYNDLVGSRVESSFNNNKMTQDVSNVQGGNQSNMAIEDNDTSRINNHTHHVNTEGYHNVTSGSTRNDPVGSGNESSLNNNGRTQDVSNVQGRKQSNMSKGGNDASRVNNYTYHVNQHKGYHNISSSSTHNDLVGSGIEPSFNNNRRIQDVSNVRGGNQSNMARGGGNDTSKINNLTHHVNHKEYHNISSSSTHNDPVGSGIEPSFNNNKRLQDVSNVQGGNQSNMARGRGNDMPRVNNHTDYVEHEGHHNLSYTSTRNNPIGSAIESSFNNNGGTQDVSNAVINGNKNSGNTRAIGLGENTVTIAINNHGEQQISSRSKTNKGEKSAIPEASIAMQQERKLELPDLRRRPQYFDTPKSSNQHMPQPNIPAVGYPVTQAPIYLYPPHPFVNNATHLMIFFVFLFIAVCFFLLYVRKL